MIFSDGVLAGRRVAVAGGVAPAILATLERLGARVDPIEDALVLAPEAAADWVRARAPLHALVFDGGPSFATGGPGALRRMLQLAWLATQAVATGALIRDAGDGGRLLLIAPSPAAGEHAEAARAGLENLARTLSVEWARFAVSAVALCPGHETTPDELAGLVAFLLSAAGGYYSGCRFDLGVAHDDHARATRA